MTHPVRSKATALAGRWNMARPDLQQRIEKARTAPAIYFGCWDGVGHHFALPNGQRPPYFETNAMLPWEGSIDGCLWKVGNPPQGTARLFTKDGWTALVVADRTVDSRGGSHSTFLFHDTLTFDEAVALVAEHFPRIAARVGPITEDERDY